MSPTPFSLSQSVFWCLCSVSIYSPLLLLFSSTERGVIFTPSHTLPLSTSIPLSLSSAITPSVADCSCICRVWAELSQHAHAHTHTLFFVARDTVYREKDLLCTVFSSCAFHSGICSLHSLSHNSLTFSPWRQTQAAYNDTMNLDIHAQSFCGS